MSALKQQGFDETNNEHIIIVCGDLFDRGSQTIEVFNFAKKMIEQGRFIYVRGNHEDLLFEFMKEISRGRIPGQHHFGNGTAKTVQDFCKLSDYAIYDPSKREDICNSAQELLDFISNNSIDYFELGDKLFVHGWLPCYQGLEDFHDASLEDWERARWENGMEMWRYKKCRPDNKTVICGHWHCSWGWSHLRQERKEFPQKNYKNWQKSFDPFIDEGIIAIDACTAYTQLCNVVVFDELGNILNMKEKTNEGKN
jgi:serine/threonine protein phosphatase 1